MAPPPRIAARARPRQPSAHLVRVRVRVRVRARVRLRVRVRARVRVGVTAERAQGRVALCGEGEHHPLQPTVWQRATH